MDCPPAVAKTINRQLTAGPTSFRFVWSFRLANDPGSCWDAYKDLNDDVAWTTSRRNLVKARA